MKKLLFTLVLLSPFLIDAKSNCTSWHRKDFKTGVSHSTSSIKIPDCHCHCTGPRTEKNICLECGHGHHPEKLKSKSKRSFKKDTIDEAYEFVDEAYDFVVDLVSTDTSSR